jgi:DNA-binding YbaB/EbfC family protein
MFKGIGDLAGLVKNAREIQLKLDTLRQSLAEETAEGVAGGGMVRIQGKGDGTVLAVNLDRSLVQAGDAEMLEDLVLTAMNSFNQKLADLRREKVIELTGGMGLPPGFDLGL